MVNDDLLRRDVRLLDGKLDAVIVEQAGPAASAHHGGDHAVRVVPICPELRAILAEALEPGAEAKESLIVPMASRNTVNLRTQFERIIAKAGHEPWPRLFQNLRASCETDWVEKYPSHVVAKWLGHSPKVAAQHYLMSREHHFEDVVRGSGDVASGATSGQGSVTGSGCSADCSSPVVQNTAQQASARDSAPSHETTEPAATTRVTAGSSDLAPFVETVTRQEAAQKTARRGHGWPGGREVAGAGFEPATSRL